jgi:hypothetical protein
MVEKGEGFNFSEGRGKVALSILFSKINSLLVYSCIQNMTLDLGLLR